jgi:hypothetical protein
VEFCKISIYNKSKYTFDTAMSALSNEISEIFYSPEDRTLGQILDVIATKSYGFIFIILALPSALPVPAPGYSTPFGIVLCILGIQYAIGRKTPWFPEWVRKTVVPKQDREGKFLQGVIKFVAFFEKFVKPRKLVHIPIAVKRALIGSVIVLCAISMVLPIPLTNTVPAIGIFILGLGFLQGDELFELLGIFVSFAGITITTLILTFGLKVVESAIQYGKDLIF